MGAFTLGLARPRRRHLRRRRRDRPRPRPRGARPAARCSPPLGLVGWALASAPWMLYAAWVRARRGDGDDALRAGLQRPHQALPAGATATPSRGLTLVGGFASTLSFPAVAGARSAPSAGAARCSRLAAVLALPRRAAARLGAARAGPAWLHPAHRRRRRRRDLARGAPRAGVLVADRCASRSTSFVSAALWAHVIPALADKGFSEAQALAVLVWFGPAQVAGASRCTCSAGRALPLRLLGVVRAARDPGRARSSSPSARTRAGAARLRAAVRRRQRARDDRPRRPRARSTSAAPTSAASAARCRRSACCRARWRRSAPPGCCCCVGGYRDVMLALALLVGGARRWRSAARAPARRTGPPRALRRAVRGASTSFSRRIWKRDRKLLPSSTVGIGAGTTTALDVAPARRSPTRTERSVTMCTGTAPLAVCVTPALRRCVSRGRCARPRSRPSATQGGAGVDDELHRRAR